MQPLPSTPLGLRPVLLPYLAHESLSPNSHWCAVNNDSDSDFRISCDELSQQAWGSSLRHQNEAATQGQVKGMSGEGSGSLDHSLREMMAMTLANDIISPNTGPDVCIHGKIGQV